MPKLGGSNVGPSAFDEDEIDYSSNAWLAYVIKVSVWLYLDSNLSEHDEPGSAAATLFDELAPEKGKECFTLEAEHVVMTDFGMQTLEERLSRAVSNRATFLQLLDEEASLPAATKVWIDAWDEEAPSEPLSINANVDTWRINELSGIAEDGELDLNPTYQRDYVWSNSESQLLIESILRGIPLPSIILARMSDSSSYQIVDGKQRVTTILRFIGKHPEGLKKSESLKEPELFPTNFGAFVRRNNLRARDLREKYFPFKTKKYPADDPLAPLGGKYYCDIKDEKVQIAGEMVTVGRLFERASVKYLIPVLIYENTLVRDIHKVFRLYNQQGMKLNAEEIRNAVFNHLTISRHMLFLGGDRPEPEMAPDLVEAGIDPSLAYENIDAFGFSTKRFRRTKILFWTVATLILKTEKGRDGTYVTPSTATHIDRFLRNIDEGRLAQFKTKDTLEKLATDLIAALELLHQRAPDAWHPKFRRKGKSEMASRWEELPVVASLIACLILVMTKNQQKLEAGIEDVRELTSKMIGPESTQNKTQWAHIANSAVSILETLGINLEEADQAIKDRYGDSALSALLEIRKIPITLDV